MWIRKVLGRDHSAMLMDGPEAATVHTYSTKPDAIRPTKSWKVTKGLAMMMTGRMGLSANGAPACCEEDTGRGSM